MSSSHGVRALHDLRAVLKRNHLTGANCISVLPISRSVRRATNTSFTPGPVCFSPRGVIGLTVRKKYGTMTSAFNVLNTITHGCTRGVPFIIGLGRGRLLDCPAACSRMLFNAIGRT